MAPCKDVEKGLEKDANGSDGSPAAAGFEQYMKEEDEVRVDWQNGKHETARTAFETCGDRNAWDKIHTCCEQQCTGVFTASHAFPFAAWDDISGAKLDTDKVVEERKAEI